MGYWYNHRRSSRLSGCRTAAVAIAIPVGAIVAGAIVAGLGISFIHTKQSYGGYRAVKHPGDHSPNHVHLQGTDGSDVRIGENGNPLDGEPFLIDQEIALSDLCHKNLQDKWLLKLYEKNHKYFECMITVYRRNIIEDTLYMNFIELVKKHLNLYSIYYVLIELSNKPQYSILQLKKLIFLCKSYLDNINYPFMKKYVDYYLSLYDGFILNHYSQDNKCVFQQDDFLKLYKVKNCL